ncbi:MAG TPA: rod shape-determining protein MreC, partial [Candidatus Xenobia bacterium]
SCEMRYLDPNAGVRTGDMVMTSGQDGYPEGLAVGRIISLHPGTDGVSMVAEIRPAVSLDTVREVLVVTGKGTP